MTLSKKQTIIGIFAVLLLLAIAPVASAQVTPDEAAEARAMAEAEREAARAEAQALREEAVEERAEIREEAQALREEAQAERAEAKEERQAALSEKRLAQIENRTDFVIARMSAAVERLNQVIGRVDSRMDALSASGVDTTAAREELNNAADAVADAETALSGIEAIVDTVLSSEEPRTAWQETGKPAFSAIRDNLKSSHASIKAAVAALKEAAANAREEAEAEEDLETDEDVVEDEA